MFSGSWVFWIWWWCDWLLVVVYVYCVIVMCFFFGVRFDDVVCVNVKVWWCFLGVFILCVFCEVGERCVVWDVCCGCVLNLVVLCFWMSNRCMGIWWWVDWCCWDCVVWWWWCCLWVCCWGIVVEVICDSVCCVWCVILCCVWCVWVWDWDCWCWRRVMWCVDVLRWCCECGGVRMLVCFGGWVFVWCSWGCEKFWFCIVCDEGYVCVFVDELMMLWCWMCWCMYCEFVIVWCMCLFDMFGCGWSVWWGFLILNVCFGFFCVCVVLW